MRKVLYFNHEQLRTIFISYLLPKIKYFSKKSLSCISTWTHFLNLFLIFMSLTSWPLVVKILHKWYTNSPVTLFNYKWVIKASKSIVNYIHYSHKVFNLIVQVKTFLFHLYYFRKNKNIVVVWLLKNSK